MKNNLKVFGAKLTTLTHGINIIKVDGREDVQLDMLATVLEQRLAEGWRIDGISAVGDGIMVYTLIKDPEPTEDAEPWQS